MPLKATPYVQKSVESYVEAEDISLSEMDNESPLHATLASEGFKKRWMQADSDHIRIMVCFTTFLQPSPLLPRNRTDS